MELTREMCACWEKELRAEDVAAATVQRYMGVVVKLCDWLEGREMTRELLASWRESLTASPATVNVAIAAVNRLLRYLDLDKMKLRQLKRQRNVYRPEERELSREEYCRLVRTAEARGNIRLARALECICSLGLRVSELPFVTVESLQSKTIHIRNKGKNRVILIGADLTRVLRQYCKSMGIKHGPVFITRRGTPLGRKQLWAEMKSLCKEAGVDPRKVFPHNLRHLFAVTYYRLHRDLARLADLLGHSSVNTTRIYLSTSGAEQRRELDSLGLLLSDPVPLAC